MIVDTSKCLICKKHNETQYWHIDKEQGSIWCWCNGCGQAYSLYSYCHLAKISLSEFLKNDFKFIEDKPNEVQKMLFPNHFLPMSDPRSQPGIEYVMSRGLTLRGEWYYDVRNNGIVFPYFFQNSFVGSQTRYIVPRVNIDGDIQKIGTLPGTRLGLIFYNWSQGPFIGDVKAIIVVEGAFNSISISQALNASYDGIHNNPFRCIATSGSGASMHHREKIKELKDMGFKTIIAPDSDEAGIKMLKKFNDFDSATHYALTGDSELDWNDMLKQMGHKEFAKYFISRVTKI